MIGSIGADNRYSTKYNNLKSNRESDKWGGTLTQTVDKNTSSRADVNRAKKSTAMDSYLVLSGNGVNNLKQAYSQYESENYRIVPDNEAGCFDIYNKDGERLGAFSYSDIKIRQDEITGKQFLISEHGTMNYDALVLDDELKDALQNVMDKDALDVETLQGFTLNIHSGTGIQYLVKDGEEGRGGKVLLQNEADRKKYEELAEMYSDKYPNLIESREEGFIWADLEIRGMAKRTDQGIISIGSVFAFITYSAYVTGPISAILNIGYLLSGIIPSTKRYYEFMALEEEKENEEGMTEPCFGDLELQNLSFSYEKDKAVLSDINIAFPKGSKTVLIGRNGSGKSTLISLLLQLYQPTGGKITLNGIDISEFVLREYRNMISVVSQEIYLFNSSIRDNICMYKNIDDKTIMEACKDSGLADFISEVSLDYVVGQNGAMLSEGQKQKIALARALVHNSPVIIFDEATSNTDVYSEHQINGLLHTKLKEKTVIIITHKQEILKEADQIIMLKDGAVVGSGVYDDLSKDNLEFKNMLKMGENIE